MGDAKEMNDLIIYAIFSIMGIAIVYLIYKIGQPVEIRGTRQPREKDNFIDDIGEIGDILIELKPEIVTGLKLKEEQEKSLTNWINTIDKTLKSKMVKWALRKFM